MRTRHLIALGLAAISLAAAGCGEEESGLQKDEAAEESNAPAEPEAEAEAPPETSGELKEKPKITVPKTPAPKELQIKDLVKGEGATAKAGSQISVNYSGVAYSTGKEFDTSYGNEPFSFELGAGGVIPGWDEGVVGMKVGGQRQLVIPPALGYGETGQGEDIGPNETLIFVIDLLSVG